MMRRIAMPAALALWLGAMATTVQAAKPSVCLTPTEASGLFLFVTPDAIEAAAMACATTLPPTALLRQKNGPFVAKYRAEADAAWPQAQAAMGKIGGMKGSVLTESELLRPMMSAMLAQIIIKAVKPKDCAAIDHILTLLEPLPAHNAAELVVAVVQLADENKVRKGEAARLPICPSVQP